MTTPQTIAAMQLGDRPALRSADVYLLVDEAHQLLGEQAVYRSAVAALPRKSVLAMSATPLVNGLKDLYSHGELLRPGLFGTADTFKSRLERIDAGLRADATEEERQQMQAECHWLAQQTQQLGVFRTEPLDALPALTVIKMCCKVTGDHGEHYARLAARLGGKQPAQAKVTMTSLRLAATEGHSDGAGVNSGKLQVVRRILSDVCVARGHRMVISTAFTKNFRCISDICDDLGLPYLTYSGDSTTCDRNTAHAAFAKGTEANSVRVLILSATAGGMGLTLTGAAHMIIVEPSFNLARELQQRGRVHRRTQAHDCVVYQLASTGTIDEHMWALQQEKQREITVLPNVAPPLGSEMVNTNVKGILLRACRRFNPNECLTKQNNVNGDNVLNAVALPAEERGLVMDLVTTGIVEYADVQHQASQLGKFK